MAVEQEPEQELVDLSILIETQVKPADVARMIELVGATGVNTLITFNVERKFGEERPEFVFVDREDVEEFAYARGFNKRAANYAFKLLAKQAAQPDVPIAAKARRAVGTDLDVLPSHVQEVDLRSFYAWFKDSGYESMSDLPGCGELSEGILTALINERLELPREDQLEPSWAPGK